MIAIGNFGDITALGQFNTAVQTGPLVSAIIGIITIVAGLYFLVSLAIHGLSFATAGGDEKELGKAKKAITNAITGLVIVVASYFVAGYLGKRLGFTSLLSPSISGSTSSLITCVNISYTVPPATPIQPYSLKVWDSTYANIFFERKGSLVGNDVIAEKFTIGRSTYNGVVHVTITYGASVAQKVLNLSTITSGNCVDLLLN